MNFFKKVLLKKSARSDFKVFKGLVISATIVLLTVETVFAAHPLITDDTGTQGKGKFQLEVNSEIAYDKERVFDEGGKVTEKTESGEVATILSSGLGEDLDLVLGLPYQWNRVRRNGRMVADVEGISDLSLELKWRFFEKEGLSFALKSGVTLPSGNENKGLGKGKISYGLVLITTMERTPFTFHLNSGYTHNEYMLAEDIDTYRKETYHLSLASELEVVSDLRVVGNIGLETNPHKRAETHPLFILGGLIYLLSETIAIDFGIKGGVNKPETDAAFLAGVTIWF